MEDDDLLRKLGRHVRAEDPAAADADPIWERLAQGELSPTEDAALRERAAKDPETAALYEAYRPLDARARERIAARATGAAPANVVPMRRLALIAAPLVAAAAVVLLLLRPAGPSSSPTVPAYALTFEGGDRPTRGAEPGGDDPPPVLRPGSRFAIVLRPETRAPASVVVRAFLLRGQEARAWDVTMDRSPGGAVRVAGDTGTLLAGLPAGGWDLVFVVGAPGTDPSPREVARVATGDSEPHPWQLLRHHVEVVTGP